MFVVDKETAEYVFSELDKRNVYYYVMKERDAEVMARYKSKKALGDFIKTISDGEIEMDITEDIKFSVHFRNSGLVNYLIREYSVSQYPKDEVEYGNYLYFSSTEERRKKEGSDCIGGCYLFYLPSTYEEYFRREIKKREIQVGTPAGASWTHMNISAGRWYVVDLPDMPATELLIHEMTENLMETHFVSLFDDAATEYRMFDPTGLSIMSHRQSIYGMSTGKRDWTTVGTMVIPILDYIKKGFVVNNDPKPKTRADIENFNKGTHLPYYKPEVTTSPTAQLGRSPRKDGRNLCMAEIVRRWITGRKCRMEFFQLPRGGCLRLRKRWMSWSVLKILISQGQIRMLYTVRAEEPKYMTKKLKNGLWIR